MPSPTVLLIGASGRLGLQIIRAASVTTSPPTIHAFCRTPSKLSSSDTALCASVVRGDARLPADLRRALAVTNADTVVMAVGVPDSTAKTDLREMTAKALMDVIKPGSKFDHVKVIVVSSTDAGGTKIDIGFGVGKVMSVVLRCVMKDHDNQESQFKSRIGDHGRLLIVRPTGLMDGNPPGRPLHSTRMPEHQLPRLIGRTLRNGLLMSCVLEDLRLARGQYYGYEGCET